MSGIAGIIHFTPSANSDVTVQKITQTLKVRGPDRQNCWSDEHCILIHTMLCTTPESLVETLPLHHNESKTVITADARIDNRDDLSNQLGISKKALLELSDSQLILYSYLKWGADCPKFLIGDFAFVIWDQRKRQLFCARDHIGVKSLYYYHCKDFFIFGSEIKALFCDPRVPQIINDQRIYEHLSLGHGSPENTFYSNINKLINAHTLTVNQDILLKSRYFSFDYKKKCTLASTEECIEAYKELFVDIIKQHSRSAFPLGSALSGGLDSSSIACVARDIMVQQNKSLHTFSAIFSDLTEEEHLKVDEREYMDSVIDQGGVIPHFVDCSHSGPFLRDSKIIQRHDEAQLEFNSYIHDLLFKKAQQENVRIFLDGFDGDTTICHGYFRPTELFFKGHIKRSINEFKMMHHSQQKTPTVKKYLKNCIIRPKLPYHFKKIFYQIKGNFTYLGLGHSPFSIEKQKIAEIIKLHRKKYNHPNFITPKNVRHAHYLDFQRPAIRTTLEYLNIDTASHMIESRYPFWDRRLMELCLSFNSDLKLQSGSSRWIHRQAVKNIIPKKILARQTKSDLSPNLVRKVSKFLPNHQNFCNFDNHLSNRYINTEKLKQYAQDLSTKKIDSPNELVHYITVISLLNWLNIRRHNERMGQTSS